MAHALNIALSMGFGFGIFQLTVPIDQIYVLTSVTRGFGQSFTETYKYIRIYMIHLIPLICTSLLTYSSRIYYISEDWWMTQTLAMGLIFANYISHQLVARDVYFLDWKSENGMYPLQPFITMSVFGAVMLVEHVITSAVTGVVAKAA